MDTSPICRILKTEEERHWAQDIIRRTYTAQGYVLDQESFSTYLNSRNSTTYGLFGGGVLYGTISIIEDSENGLPMDSVCENELSQMRSGGKKLAEAVQFAVDHDLYAETFGEKPGAFVVAPLFRAVLMRSVELRIDYLCILVNPKHSRFYGMLGFKQIGEVKQYGAVDAPGVPRALYVPEARSNPIIAGMM